MVAALLTAGAKPNLRTAAEAAARIQGSFRETAWKVAMSIVIEFANKEEEAKSIIAAMKIQNAFRKYDTRRKIEAAYKIQCRFQTWKMRREFLNMRRQAIRLQGVTGKEAVQEDLMVGKSVGEAMPSPSFSARAFVLALKLVLATLTLMSKFSSSVQKDLEITSVNPTMLILGWVQQAAGMLRWLST
ncbi:unnamed protein product [Eruca vesicaria subsp. sativa]|uniref:Uncharacterized protein n=1 Tax=Eruca vesicaria subsp. sativa TaxID=29727 RepID=A0ABC8K709_ERUVS|nr:unnamed protein product [Eruca vesicaria subsp. sativa]